MQMNIMARPNHVYPEKVDYFTLNFGTLYDEFSNRKYAQNETRQKKKKKSSETLASTISQNPGNKDI